MLRKAREDMELAREAKKIPKKHTFSKLPGFHGRKVEQAFLRKVLEKDPKMTVIFGATSVGKTALLREVLAGDDYFVVKFDLRISGFADLRTLYLALCEQFQMFFTEVSNTKALHSGRRLTPADAR
jgi:AAA+ ATPase superfamily predicted ATPase